MKEKNRGSVFPEEGPFCTYIINLIIIKFHHYPITNFIFVLLNQVWTFNFKLMTYVSIVLLNLIDIYFIFIVYKQQMFRIVYVYGKKSGFKHGFR